MTEEEKNNSDNQIKEAIKDLIDEEKNKIAAEEEELNEHHHSGWEQLHLVKKVITPYYDSEKGIKVEVALDSEPNGI